MDVSEQFEWIVMGAFFLLLLLRHCCAPATVFYCVVLHYVFFVCGGWCDVLLWLLTLSRMRVDAVSEQRHVHGCGEWLHVCLY